MPKDCTFATLLLNNDEGRLSLRSFNDRDACAVHTFSVNRLDLYLANVVRADFADITSAHTQPSERDHGSCTLTAGGESVRNERDLGVEFREVRYDDEVIYRIKAESDGIEGFVRRNINTKFHLKSSDSMDEIGRITTIVLVLPISF